MQTLFFSRCRRQQRAQQTTVTHTITSTTATQPPATPHSYFEAFRAVGRTVLAIRVSAVGVSAVRVNAVGVSAVGVSAVGVSAVGVSAVGVSAVRVNTVRVSAVGVSAVRAEAWWKEMLKWGEREGEKEGRREGGREEGKNDANHTHLLGMQIPVVAVKVKVTQVGGPFPFRVCTTTQQSYSCSSRFAPASGSANACWMKPLLVVFVPLRTVAAMAAPLAPVQVMR